MNKKPSLYLPSKNLFFKCTNFLSKINNISTVNLPRKILHLLNFGGGFILHKPNINHPEYVWKMHITTLPKFYLKIIYKIHF